MSLSCWDLIPYGDRDAKQAWSELMSRDVLGAVVVGTSAGKLVEWCLTLSAYLLLGGSTEDLVEALTHIILWSITIWVGVWIFVYWHRVTQAAEDAAEEAIDQAQQSTDG